MRPSDQPEPSPRFGRVPPAPPVAPPATGEAPRPDPPSGNAPARIVGLGKLVGISSVGVVGAVWFAGVASVLSALLAGAAFALLAARSDLIARPVVSALAASLVTALASTVLSGGGSVVGGLGRGLAVWFAIAPAVITAVIYVWARGLHRRRASA
jgi:hypothetical protein